MTVIKTNLLGNSLYKVDSTNNFITIDNHILDNLQKDKVNLNSIKFRKFAEEADKLISGFETIENFEFIDDLLGRIGVDDTIEIKKLNTIGGTYGIY